MILSRIFIYYDSLLFCYSLFFCEIKSVISHKQKITSFVILLQFDQSKRRNSSDNKAIYSGSYTPEAAWHVVSGMTSQWRLDGILKTVDA